jgi:hypothetical protein
MARIARRLAASGLVDFLSMRVVVVGGGVFSGVERRIESVDTVVLATGSRSTDGIYRALKGHVNELHAVGDCVAPRGVHQAILDGTRVARAI